MAGRDGVTAPAGFTASGVAAAIKQGSTKPDCALVASDRPCSVAGMFTTNVMKAPPVLWNQGVCDRGSARAVFINSGNANAATGEQGLADAERTAALAGESLGVAPGEVCVCSTGVIGVPLPMDRIARGVAECRASLSEEGGAAAAEAIMTTDTVAKYRDAACSLSGGTVRIGAMAKGAGMIAPNMATMIAVVTTDAELSPLDARALLGHAVDGTFNCVCVDNDMSTSDTALLLANGASGVTAGPGPDGERFAETLRGLCLDLAQQLVRDGEGATKFVEVAVEGAPANSDATRVARAIAQSQLCKTAFFGEDPNWGRIACAAGYAGVPFDPADLAIWLNDVQVTAGGVAADYAERDAAAVMKEPSFRVRVSVGAGPGHATYWTSDLTHDYVSINADYRT